MKYLIIVLVALSALYPRMEKQPDPLESRVYTWPDQFENHAPGVEKALILSGSTTALVQLDVFAYNLSSGTSHLAAPTPATESLIIVKSGTVTVRHNSKRVKLGAGSVQVVFPGTPIRIENMGDEPASYYVFQYTSRQGVDVARGKKSGGSYVIDWDKLEVRETQRGEHRGYFDRPTASLSRFEMHVTTLNEGLRSHDVHTHREEEFLLIIHSEVEEHIDGAEHRASAGDLIFLDAMVPHTITNVGEGPAQYFAFKWE